MWVWLIFGLVIFIVCSSLCCYDEEDKDDTTDIPTSSDAEPLFSIAGRLENLYGGKVFVGLRIPDPHSASHQNIDLVLVTKEEVLVILVKNVASRFLAVDKDGNWFCSGNDKGNGDSDCKHQTLHIPSPVAEAKQQVSVLQSYLALRGINLPQGFLSCKVICTNPDFCTIHPDYFPSEVITYNEWVQLKPKTKTTETKNTETKNTLSDWFRGAIRGRKQEMQEMQKMRKMQELQESRNKKLKFVLSTAPMWDRLELKGNRRILGQFLEFKENQRDVRELRNIKRSKVSHLITEKPFLLDESLWVTINYTPRDYHGVWASTSGQKSGWPGWPSLVTVSSNTKVLFQARYSDKVCRRKLSSIVSMTLSA